MKKTILIGYLLIISYHSKAQIKEVQNRDSDEYRAGMSRSELRSNYEKQPQNFKVILESDTLDSFSFRGIERINCFYRNDTCYKFQTIVPFDHKEIKNVVYDSTYKKIAKNTWVRVVGSVEYKMIFNRSKDLCVMEATTISTKNKN